MAVWSDKRSWKVWLVVGIQRVSNAAESSDHKTLVVFERWC